MGNKDKLSIHAIDRFIELEYETQDIKITIKMEKRNGK